MQASVSDMVAGAGAVVVKGVAEEVLIAIGEDLFPAGLQASLKPIACEAGRQGATACASTLGVEAGVVATGTKVLAPAAKALGNRATQATTSLATRTATTASVSAGKAVLASAAGAGLVGGLIEAGLAAHDARKRYKAGEFDGAKAVAHVGKKAAIGAVAGAAGTALEAAAIMLTGGLTAPIVFGIGVTGSAGTKAFLDWLWP